MILQIILLTLLPILFIFGYKMGKKRYKTFISETLNEGTGRMGIIRYDNDYQSMYAVFEVEELDTAGDRTKIKLHKVIPDRRSEQDQSKILRYWGHNDWVPTSRIIWYDSNSQKLRDSKIKKILDE